MSDLFREVDEAVREDRVKTLARRYGGWAITGVAALILGVVGVQLWQGWEATARSQETQQMLAAISLAESAPGDAAETLTTLANQAGGGRGTLAQLLRAGFLAEEGDVAGSITVYQAIAADTGVEPLWRDYAALMAVAHGLESEDPAALSATIDRLIDGESAWRYSAQEMRGALALRQGDRDAALAAFRTLADDPFAPDALRNRSRDLVDHLDG